MNFKLIIILLIGLVTISFLKAGPVPAPKPSTEIVKNDDGTELFQVDKTTSSITFTFLKNDKNKSDITITNLYCGDTEVAEGVFIGPTGANSITFNVDNSDSANEWEYDWEVLD